MWALAALALVVLLGTGFATAAVAVDISGTVFEDVNYGGGAGRSFAAATGGSGRNGARVELYNSGGSFVSFTTTSGGGNYSFTGLDAANYTVRVVNATVSSARTGYVAGTHLSVQTFRTSASTGTPVAVIDHVGGQNPAVVDAANGGAGVTMNTTTGVFTTGITGTAQSITNVALGASNIANVDFGYNFDTIVNVNDSGQGSLRRFIINSNGLNGEASLAQSGSRQVAGVNQALPAGRETSIFMIPDGTARPGLRAGLANQLTSGVGLIVPVTPFEVITGADTIIDGTTQTVNVGNTNTGILGAGGTAGVDGLTLQTVHRPEVQLTDSGVHHARGLDVQANNVTVRGIAISGFGNNRSTGTGEANIRIGAVSGAVIEQNILGTSATSFSDPGAAGTLGDNITLVGPSGAIIRNNLIGYAHYMGVLAIASSAGTLIEGNEIRGNGIGRANQDGVSFEGNSGTGTVRGNLIAGTEGNGVDMASSSGSNTIVNNTITGNGIGTDASLETPGIRVFGIGNLIDRNIISANFGAGVIVRVQSTGNTITRNSIFSNGTITNKGGGAPSVQIGIDLHLPTDLPKTGTAPFVTINDNGDADTGGNGLLNFPVITGASIAGGNLVLSGFARPGSAIEFFISDGDPSGFGEGQTYLTTLTEGSGADTDTDSGTYTSPVNGLDQGTDTTNRFSFTIPVPLGVSNGTRLTATATLAGNTSEFSGVIAVGGGISGRIFEDVNYGGGAGRSFAAATGGSGRDNARVELYDSGGSFVGSTTTSGGGNYSFAGLGAGNYTVRVVNSSVSSGRAGYIAGLLPVQTFRTNASTGSAVAVTDYVGGQNPAVADTANGVSGAIMNTATGVFTAGITGTAQSITNVTLGAPNIASVDFGYNFDTVVNVNNTGQGSLRQSITNANTLGGDASLVQAGRPAAIENALFMISNGTATAGLRASNNYFSGGVTTITPTSALQTISAPLVLNAQAQPGWTSNPIVRLDGVSAGADVDGLSFGAASGASIVRGMMITRFTHDGLRVESGANGVVIAGNWIGTAGTGTTGTGNGDDNIDLRGANAVIGGTGAADRNVINNAGDDGITINGAGTSILGNYIGLDPDGATGGGNGDVGIALLAGASSTTIGGTSVAARNVISMNFEGIEISAANNVVQGNYIGTDAGGTLNRGQRSSDAVEIISGGTNNLIGGTAAGAGNLIAFTQGGHDGVSVEAGSGNAVLGNRIHSNTGLGIDLANDGVTVNDGLQTAGQPNLLMDTPVFTSVALSGTTLTVAGYVGNTPSLPLFGGARVEIFRSDNDPSGSGEGRAYLGFQTADANGNFGGSLTVSGLSVGDRITGTATDGSNNTSEFSANRLVVNPGISVDPTSGLTTTEAGGTATFTVVLDTQPTSDVAVGLSSSDLTEGTVGPDSLTFTSGNWNVAQTVTVTGVDDAVADGDVLLQRS